MIGKILQEILNEKNMNANELAKLIGVSNQTLYSIIKRDNMKIDFDVLLKICSSLDVNVERFYSEYQKSNDGNVILSNHERKLVLAYRAKTEMQTAVDTLLGIHNEEAINNNKIPSPHQDVEVAAMVDDDFERQDMNEFLKNNRKTSSVD